MLSRHHEVALLHPDLDRVLVVDSDGRTVLPSLSETWPDHRDLVTVVGDRGAFLAVPPERGPDGLVVDVMLGSSTDPGPFGSRWLPLDDVARILPAATGAAVVKAADELREGPPWDGRAAWFRPGWRAEVASWVRDRLAEHGATPEGPAEPVKVWSLAAVLRIPARTGGDPAEFWFKATCTGFRTEPTLTAAIRRFAPDHTPHLLAVDQERAWMLMTPLPAQDPPPVREWAPQVAETLARVQVDALAHLDELRTAGLPDRGLHQTLVWLDTVMESSVELPLMTELQRTRARDLKPWLSEKVRQIFGLGIPLTLVHGDLHLGNTAPSAQGPLLYDWTDACLSHPWFDVRHLAASAGGEVEEEQRAQVMDGVRRAHARQWQQACPSADLDRAWELSRVAESVFTLISYEQIYRAQPTASRWELATVVIEILDKLAAIRDEERD